MLFQYLQKTQLLLNDVSMAVYNKFDLTSYINTARNQVSGEAECIRTYASLATVANTQSYSFSSIAGLQSGVAGVLDVRIALVSAAGSIMQARPWEWFAQYYLNPAAPVTGTPTIWSQYGQGVSGSIYLYPVPASVLTINLDSVCYPSPLASDADPEAIPYPWTDAIPYFAAYLALLNSQQPDQAASMFAQYELFALRGRQITTPTVLPGNYPGGRGARGAGSKVILSGAGAAPPGG